MPAKDHASHWRKPDGSPPLLFERGQKVVTPSGRVASLRQYWSKADHEYSGCGAIKYEDNGETAVISLSLLRAWQPGVTYTAPELIKIKPIPAPTAPVLRIAGHIICAGCPFIHSKPKRARPTPVEQLSFPFFEAAM